MNLSAFPQDLTLPTAAPAARDSPDIDIEDDGSFAWVVFRQDFGGGSRTVGRRLIGSQFEPRSSSTAGPSDGRRGST